MSEEAEATAFAALLSMSRDLRGSTMLPPLMPKGGLSMFGEKNKNMMEMVESIKRVKLLRDSVMMQKSVVSGWSTNGTNWGSEATAWPVLAEQTGGCGMGKAHSKMTRRRTQSAPHHAKGAAPHHDLENCFEHSNIKPVTKFRRSASITYASSSRLRRHLQQEEIEDEHRTDIVHMTGDNFDESCSSSASSGAGLTISTRKRCNKCRTCTQKPCGVCANCTFKKKRKRSCENKLPCMLQLVSFVNGVFDPESRGVLVSYLSGSPAPGGSHGPEEVSTQSPIEIIEKRQAFIKSQRKALVSEDKALEILKKAFTQKFH